MKVIYFSAALFVLLIACDASDEPKCTKVGESYEKDCNTCTCTEGGAEICTVRACYTGPQFPDTAVEDHTEIPETNGQVCTPNETKMEDCNRCKCSANGIVWICTRRMCSTTPAPKIPVNEPGFTCIPNQVFKDDCNTCSCDESGKLARCTAMACDPNERQKRSNTAGGLVTTTELPQLREKQCVPGTRWKNECNWCWCSETGFAACTLKGCLGSGQKFHHKQFHPAPALNGTISESRPGNNRVQRDTNEGYQKSQGSKSKKGKNQSITSVPDIKISPPDNHAPESSNQYEQDPSYLGYDPRSTIKPTYYVSAHPTGTTYKPPAYVSAHPTGSTPPPRLDYGSTSQKEFTEAQILDPNFTCTPSESFKVECNTCWCSASGKKVRYCTRQACHPKSYPTLAPAH